MVEKRLKKITYTTHDVNNSSADNAKSAKGTHALSALNERQVVIASTQN